MPVYAPSSTGGFAADESRAADSAGWQDDGELRRTAATLHPEDDDFGQAGTLVREVLDDAARERLANNIAGHVGQVTVPDIKVRALQYWRNVDESLCARVESLLAAGSIDPDTAVPNMAGLNREAEADVTLTV